uniref:hypothetical protein n=1 Tax=Coleofasciculus sp. FACHB-125 TaxID=2692784 RepID=UPI0030DB62CD
MDWFFGLNMGIYYMTDRANEIGLGIGRGRGTYQGWTREWLYWYDCEGIRFPTPEEQAEQAQQQLGSLIAKLKERGIDPDILKLCWLTFVHPTT